MTYRKIASTETDPLAPLVSALFKALDGNVDGAFSGDANAPRLRLPALERLVAGTSIRIRADANTSIAGAATTFGNVLTAKFLQPGTVRFAWEHRVIANQQVETRILRTRAAVNTVIGSVQTTTSTSFQTCTADVDVQPGDIFAVQSRMNTSSSGGEIRNKRLQVDAATYLWPVEDMFGVIEGNPTITSP